MNVDLHQCDICWVGIVITFGSFFHLSHGLQGMRGLIIPVSGPLRRCSARSAIILVAITVLPPAPAVAQYAEEWHEWHGQQWNGGPSGLPPPPGPSLGYQYGTGYPAPGSYDPDHSYGYYPYPAQPYPYGYSAGFSEGFAAGYDHGFTGGLNNAFAGAYDSGYAGRYGYGGYRYPHPHTGFLQIAREPSRAAEHCRGRLGFAVTRNGAPARPRFPRSANPLGFLRRPNGTAQVG